MGIMKTEPPMSGLSPQQRAEAERLFSQALQCAKGGDYAGAAKYYQQSAQYGHPGAQNNLGNLYKAGRGVPQDLQEAFRLYLAAAQHGNKVAMRNLAACYQKAIGTAADFDQAVAWLMTAAEQKDHLACAALAGIYGSWNHKDDGKNLYWHKKAAEYGNADSMFILGGHYAAKGEHQDLVQAVNYYDSAAKAGTPEVKLKVAQAFDHSRSNTEQPLLDLEKAREWYIEVINCGAEKEQLAAAEGLDELYDYSNTLIRGPLDMEKAYITYRTLAMKGNPRACSLSAYCSEMGRGTVPNLDIAIMFYEKAKEFGKAQWCRKKKAGNLSDPVYEAHKGYQMPPVNRNTYSHKKELYREDVDSKKCMFNGRVYYVVNRCGTFLCSSNPDGTDLQILLELDSNYADASIYADYTGIYVYCVQPHDKCWLWVLHTDFHGNKAGEYRDEYQKGWGDGHLIKSVYFHNGYTYYVYEYDDQKGRGAQIKRMDVDCGYTDVLYTKATSVQRVFATDETLIFFAEYENDAYDAFMRGWMLLDLRTKEVECLSNPYCSPENVVDYPEVFDEENPSYNENYRFNRNIVFFDLDREIFWTERTDLEGTDSAHLKTIYYWEPKPLWGDRDQVLPNLPVWRITHNTHGSRDYFDGMFCYHAEHYYDFKALDRDGTVFDWSRGNGGHGVCDKFIVTGDYLFLDIAAFDEEQYHLSTQKTDPIRKSWFKELPNDLIDAFRSKSVSADPVPDTLAPTPAPAPVAPPAANTAAEATKKAPPAPSAGSLSVEKTLGETDIKYNICTFGSKFHIGFGVPVVIQINGRRYECKMHKTAKGRIDGMKKLYAENGIVLGDVLKADYIQKDNVILLEKI